MIRVAINGFGRIGRSVLRAYFTNYPKPGLEFVGINDITDTKTLAHLLKYDSNFGTFSGNVSYGQDWLEVNGKKIKVLAEPKLENLPWGSLGVDVVLECTGLHTKKEKAIIHLEQGAKKVLVSAPCDDADLTIAFGVNHQQYDRSRHNVVSCASCTTNCLAPGAFVLNEVFGIKNGLMTTAHAYTND
ncbi:MAG: type I glyceraldehyde-3-phosphate dehydrogenase, partial [Deltaproteobacteria bacterium]|nr:type I glyceraldehyde-3-phosphate dehydrogenase [Deltaproteobacteria bacterium]